MKKAINLLELIIAIILLVLIIFGTTAFDIGNRGLLDYSEDRATLINEANLVLDRISRDGVFAIGDTANPAFTHVGTNILSMRQDTNLNGRLDGADQIVTYTYNAGNHTVTRGGEIITSRAVDFTVTPQPVGVNPPTSYVVSITLQRDPAEVTRDVATGALLVTADRAMRNPQVTSQTRVVSSAYSIH